jgi:hypothetical protein
MALKPLTAAQKRVIKSLAFAFVATDVEQNVAGFEGFLKSALKSNPSAAQAKRAFNSAVHQVRSEFSEVSKSNGT